MISVICVRCIDQTTTHHPFIHRGERPRMLRKSDWIWYFRPPLCLWALLCWRWRVVEKTNSWNIVMVIISIQCKQAQRWSIPHICSFWYTATLGRGSNNQNGNLRWFLPLGVDPPPLIGTNFQTFFYPTFFLLQLNPTYMKRILHFKNIIFKSSYNWFKIDIHQQLRPLTANYLAMFKVISTTIYT